LDNGLFFVSISFGSLLLTVAVGFIIYGIYWLSTKRIKTVSIAEEFKEIWTIADELAKKDIGSGLEDRREKYVRMMLNLEE